MNAQKQKLFKRVRRHRRVRSRLWGTSERPRLVVFRSNKHIFVQVIDDERAATLVSAASVDEDVKKDLAAVKDGSKNGGNVKAAAVVGTVLAKRCAAKGIAKACFDRGGYRYHGRVKALAEAARKGGLKF